MADKVGGNPWLRMWVAPRETIRQIVSSNPKQQLYLLASIYGFSTILHFAQNFSLGSYLPWGTVLLGALVFSLFVGLIGLYIGAKLLMWTGRWIGGTGSFNQIRAALCWSNVTNVVNILMWLVLVFAFGSVVFTQSFASATFVGAALAVAGTAFLVQAVVAVWGFVIMLKALGEVQGFSAWKALLNVVIVFALVAIVIWILMLFFMWINGSSQIATQ